MINMAINIDDFIDIISRNNKNTKFIDYLCSAILIKHCCKDNKENPAMEIKKQKIKV